MPRVASSRTTSRENYKLGVSSYDRASSLLLSLLVMVGVAVGGLLIIFFARQFTIVQTAIPVTALNPGERTPDAAQGLKEDIEPPGLEEAPELDEPQLQETLNALANAVSSRSAVLSDESIDSNAEASRGSGFGDARQAGSGSGVPVREPRRELRYEPASEGEYARFLDAYKAELSVWSNANTVHYARNLSKATPDTRIGEARQERRFFFQTESPLFERMNLKLARKAGISDKGSLRVIYYPPEAESILLGLEKKAAGDKPVESLQFTAFRVTRDGDRFTFSVEEQQ